MKLVPNAKRILMRGWSVWAAAAIAIINGAVVIAVQYGDSLPVWLFASVNILGPLAIVFLRLIDQGLADGE